MKKFIDLIIYGLMISGLIVLCFLTPFNTTWRIIFTVMLALTLIALILGKFKFKRIYKTVVMFLFIEAVIMIAYVILYYTGLLSHFKDTETLRSWLQSFGAWGYVIFFVIQLAQVILLPIPANITTTAGAIAFSFWPAFLISTAAIVLGSLLAFGIGKIFGDKVAYKIAEKETVDKYKNVLTRKGILLLPIMFLFPLFPDDLLCFIAGSTKMTWKYFITATLLTRPIGIACICLFLSGDLIPFSGWGIPVWIAIVIVLALTCFFLIKYQNKITDWLIEKFSKRPRQNNQTKNKRVKNPEKTENSITTNSSQIAQSQFEMSTENSEINQNTIENALIQENLDQNKN